MSASDDYVTVSQADNGEVTAALYISEYVVVELGATTTATVTFTIESSDLVLCSAEAYLSQFVTCPSALSSSNCVSAVCDFSAPNSSESIVVKASVVICSDLDPECLLGYSIKAKSTSVVLSVATISTALATVTTTTTASEQQSTTSSADPSSNSNLNTMEHDQQSFSATGTSNTRAVSTLTQISTAPTSLSNMITTATSSNSSNSPALSFSAIAAIVLVFLVLSGLIYYLWTTRKTPQHSLHRFPSLHSKDFVQLEDAPAEQSVDRAVSILSAPAPSLQSDQSKNTLSDQSKKTNSSQFSYVPQQSLLDFHTQYDAEPMPQVPLPGTMKQLAANMQIIPSPTSPTSPTSSTSLSSPPSQPAIYVDVFGRKIQPTRETQ
ncbi:hypothetical protein HK100_005375 [Physocladia obscura]|uniref:Uncharacterized protein n=1 Tax=Physocladia obscura TaxID=109957 RepID=A0AAD5X9E0_9FUNG|nr:hypothetical protein HK100_005375 [Physocladia obscura]